MKNVLIYSFWCQDYQEACQIEAANKHLNEGDNVLFITCGSKVGFCNDNYLGSTLACSVCQKKQIHRAKKWVSKVLDVHCINEYISKDIQDFANEYVFEYDNLEKLKDVVFEGVEIGYGAISSYVSYTRNIEPEMNRVRPYLDSLMRMEIRTILAFKQIINNFKPDLIIFHNGRFAHFKPIYGLALVNNIDFICTETVTASDGTIQIDNIPNNIPHDFVCRGAMFKDFYDKQINDVNRETVGRSFFENRKKAVFAGDTIYVKDQIQGKMPDGWSEEVENIVIFNSSEDEFFAIGSKYRNVALFKTQLDGIIAIMEHYKTDKSKHFTLRVHPNLKGLPFNYHLGLYKLNYPNLTVISADSDISSYALMEAADKVITFGSTMGIESTYWKKPSISIGFAFYRTLDVVYTPSNLEELWDLIDNRNLTPKEQRNCLPYGYYFMSNKHEHFKFVNVGKVMPVRILKKRTHGYNYYTLMGSTKLYCYFYLLWSFVRKTFPVFSKFRSIPT